MEVVKPHFDLRKVSGLGLENSVISEHIFAEICLRAFCGHTVDVRNGQVNLSSSSESCLTSIKEWSAMGDFEGIITALLAKSCLQPHHQFLS